MIRFMADADLNGSIVGGCCRREPTIDFLSANDANLEGYPIPTCWLWPLRRIAFSSQTISKPCLGILANSPGSWLQPGSDPRAPTHAYRRSDRGTLADLGCVRRRGVERSVAGAAPAVPCALTFIRHAKPTPVTLSK